MNKVFIVIVISIITFALVGCGNRVESVRQSLEDKGLLGRHFLSTVYTSSGAYIGFDDVTNIKKNTDGLVTLVWTAKDGSERATIVNSEKLSIKPSIDNKSWVEFSFNLEALADPGRMDYDMPYFIQDASIDQVIDYASEIILYLPVAK